MRIREQQWHDIEEFGKLEACPPCFPWIGTSDSGTSVCTQGDRRRDVGVLAQPENDEVCRDNRYAHLRSCQNRHSEFGSDQVGGGHWYTHTQN